ncbi:histidine kinase dimerization/phospho-acceptor domain-containing protein [Bhargavaea ullalensis]|uniref:histidine kinase n=1 Tax=Bhargavaea ullalensis TaxID=1265685 RepID=A0ABV2GB78_9BACL
MEKGKWMQAVWVLLAAFSLFALMTLIETGPRIVGKDYTETEEFKSSARFFMDNIGPYVLNPLDPDKAKEEIRVSPDEIDAHRYEYGDLDAQLESIRVQYEERLTKAENDEQKNALTEERDRKMDDIRENFTDDEHVAKKVRAEKAKDIDQYMYQLRENMNSFKDTASPFSYELTDTETGKTYRSGNVGENSVYQWDFNRENGYLKASQIADDLNYSGNVAEMIPDEVRTFEGIVTVPASVLKDASQRVWDGVYHNDDTLAWGYAQFKAERTAYTILWIAGLIAAVLALTVFKFRAAPWTDNPLVARFDRLPADIAVAGGGLAAIIGLMSNEALRARFMMFVANPGNSYRFRDLFFQFQLLLYLIDFAAFVFAAVNLYGRFQEPGRFTRDLDGAYVRKAAEDARHFFLNRKLGTQMLILLAVVFLAGVGFGGATLMPYLFAVWLPLFVFIALPVLLFMLRRTGYLNRIIDATGRLASGQYAEEVPVRGRSPFARHAADLNKLREGVELSMSEQARSERLKTELITNVSHDLRTPLTSIITYTDLLKNPELTPEERAEYVGVLDRKSQRLKTLIDDLFDVSKMATGNIELDLRRLDLVELVRQAIAEHNEEITASGLEFRTNLADGPLHASVDGQKWWRVIDNLLMNALKYSLPGTRVYISLDALPGPTPVSPPDIRFSMKNVSRFELGDSADDLFERFKRGDASRHTDGSGLGLAIAQSIVDLHGGQMTIDLDGDLFKVTVTVPGV